MRKRLAVGVLAAGLVASGVGTAYAATFDGTDMAPDYMTGITEVYAVATDGTEILVPVWSMADCDLATETACVHVSQGTGSSFVRVGVAGELKTAHISTYAAEILRVNAPATEPVAPAPETVQGVVSDVPGYDPGMPACIHEDGSGQNNHPCYWDADTRGNGDGSDVIHLGEQMPIIIDEKIDAVLGWL